MQRNKIMPSRRSKLALASIVLASVLAGTIVVLQFSQTEQPFTGGNGERSEEPHFSVRWMGFAPTDYNSSYPEYYICINNLKDNPLTMQIALQIKNQEDSGYYFLIDQYTTPPAGWTILPYEVGYVGVDETKAVVYENASRAVPSSISSGRLTENIALVVRAYYDEYETLYSEDNFIVTFNFIDRISPIWTLIYYDSFDDGQPNEWSFGGEYGTGDFASMEVSSNYYRSFQYSLRVYSTFYYTGSGNTDFVNAYFTKTYYVGTLFEEAYVICSIKSESFGIPEVEMDGSTYFRSDISPTNNVWYQFTIRLPSGEATQVRIWAFYDTSPPSSVYLDDVYVIAK